MTLPLRSPRAIGHYLKWAAVLACAALPASAQTFPFGIRLQQGGSVSTVANQGTVSLSAPGVGQTVTATLTITNQGTTTATIGSAPVLAQSGTDFSATTTATLPDTMNPGDSIVVTLKFTPSIAGGESAAFTLGYTASGTPGSIQLTLQGASGTFTVAYTMPPNQNTIPLAAGGTIQFPATQVGNTVTAAVTITNTGTAPGTISAVALSGAAYQLVSLSLLPATINPGVSFVFGIKYTPTQTATDTGSLSLNIGGLVSNYVVSGSGIRSSYSYTATPPGGTANSITPGSAVAFPDTAVGQTNSFFIQVRNVGGATGTINLISATGAFVVTDGPTLFPVTMNPNDQITFTLTFAPTLPGADKGKLTVGNDVFDLTGTGLGPKLTYSYGSASTAVLPGGLVVFPAAQVGKNSTLSFTVTNGGTSAASIASVAVADTKGIFTLQNAPGAPITLNPNDTLTFQITFAPLATGFSTTVLQVDTQSFNLSGSGNPPPSIPSFQFTGPSGTVDPLTQPSIGLTLSAPYPLALTGTLTISVNSGTLVPDPSVQFATGLKTITFSIPANSTQALFPTGGSQIGLQVGTTASTITITPTFATQAGLDLTPPAPPTVTLTVAAAAPKLLTIQITGVSQAAFSVGITGLSTPRALSTVTYAFTPAGGGQPTSYSIDVAAAAGLWYSSSGSQGFGSQFSVAVPFAVPNPSTTALATSRIKSVSVTATNAQGASNSVSLTVQ